MSSGQSPVGGIVVSQSGELPARRDGVWFAVIADPMRRSYGNVWVATWPGAVLDPRAWLAEARAVTGTRPPVPTSSQQALGLAADFLIAAEGHVLACNQGVHAYDQPLGDELAEVPSQHPPATGRPERT